MGEASHRCEGRRVRMVTHTPAEQADPVQLLRQLTYPPQLLGSLLMLRQVTVNPIIGTVHDVSPGHLHLPDSQIPPVPQVHQQLQCTHSQLETSFA
jgi:hypothetical protein